VSSRFIDFSGESSYEGNKLSARREAVYWRGRDLLQPQRKHVQVLLLREVGKASLQSIDETGLFPAPYSSKERERKTAIRAFTVLRIPHAHL
jgi:hypothetical protein